MSSLLDSAKASRLADRIFEQLDGIRTSQRPSKKRHHEPEHDPAKKTKVENNDNGKVVQTKADALQLSANQVLKMLRFYNYLVGL